MFIHHVYFWLRHPERAGDRNQLIEGLRKLSAVNTIQRYHIGRPADTHRDVVDRSYDVSWCLFFRNQADQDSYQDDPIHKQFVADCSVLWSRVVVYDSEAV